MLHVTNGDSAAQGIGASGLGGDVLPWRDVLHEGPVPAAEDAAALRETRARFIAAAGWGSYPAVLADMAARDAVLARHIAQGGDDDQIVLWFEHDLYDQLQLIQVLDRLADHPDAAARTTLIAIGEHPEVTPFYGLGQLRPDQLAALFPARQPLSAAQLALGRAAWDAFRSPDPSAIERLLAGETAPLPFLRGALVRHLEELPSVEDGLGRTERQIVEMLAAGVDTPKALFTASYQREDQPFLGDTTFFARLAALAEAPHPALAQAGGQPLARMPQGAPDPAFTGQRLVPTETGRELLAGRADWVRLNGLDRWYGGAHLTGPAPAWRWSRAAGRLVPTGSPPQS